MWSRCTSLAGTLLIHWLIMQPMLLGSTAAKRPLPEESGPGASAASSDSANYMTLVMVNLPSDSQYASESEYSSAGVANSDSPIQVASPDPAPLLGTRSVRSRRDRRLCRAYRWRPGDSIQALRQLTSQIDARIQRAAQAAQRDCATDPRPGRTPASTGDLLLSGAHLAGCRRQRHRDRTDSMRWQHRMAGVARECHPARFTIAGTAEPDGVHTRAHAFL